MLLVSLHQFNINITTGGLAPPPPSLTHFRHAHVRSCKLQIHQVARGSRGYGSRHGAAHSTRTRYHTCTHRRPVDTHAAQARSHVPAQSPVLENPCRTQNMHARRISVRVHCRSLRCGAGVRCPAWSVWRVLRRASTGLRPSGDHVEPSVRAGVVRVL